jgi:hypothetical protein
MQALERLSQFRQALYQTCTSRPAALLDLIDAVAQTARPHSPAELSLVMQRHWSSLYDALDEGAFDLDRLRPLLAQTAGSAAPYRVAGCRVVVVDHTGFPRPSARTVSERERYPGPNGTRQTGHRYSWLSQLVDADSSWLAPVDVERIGPGATPVGIALTQVARLAQSSVEPLIVVADREYGVNDVLRVVPQLPGVPITFVARVRSNLVFYAPPPPRQPGQKGAPRKYGARIQLNDPATWPVPSWSAEEVAPSGARTELRGWVQWRRRGIPHQPVQVVQVRVLRADGQPKYAQPLWLMVVGPLAWPEVAPLYTRRWREETWHRQGKDLFGWCRAQLGSVVRQDRWTWVVLLASWQLLLARDLARDCPRHWERRRAAGPLPVARVQRDYGRILQQFGLAMPAPKPRGKAPGRPVGTRLPPKRREPLLRRRQQAG